MRKALAIFCLLLAICVSGCGQNANYNSSNGGGSTTTPSNTTLSSISLSSGTLSPSFSTTTASYTSTVSNSVSSVTVTPTGSGTIKVNGTAVNSGSASGAISLSVGSNTITIKAYPSSSVTAETYTINVIRSNSGSTYYVSTSGSNSTGDGSQSKPWATPAYGVNQLQAGDTLIILGGTYTLTDYNNDRIVLARSGTSSAPIIIRGETGNRPKLAAKNTAASASPNDGLGQMVDLNNKNHTRIENIEFTHDSTASGTEKYVRDCISGSGGHITLKDLYIHHVDIFGIDLQDIDTLNIENCTIEYCGFGGIGAPDMGAGGGWKNITVDSCDLSYNGHYYRGGNDSRSAYDRPDGIGLEEGPGPITVNNCLVEHNYGDGIDLKLHNATVTNNIVRNNTANGIKIWGESSKVENCLIYGTGDGVANGWEIMVVEVPTSGTTIQLINNTIHDVGTRSAHAMIVQYDEPYRSTPITLIMKNNVFSNNEGSIWISGNTTIQMSNNLFNRSNNSTQIQYNGVGNYTASQLNSLSNCSGNISGDPKFVNPVWGGANGDYTLQSGSPAIDTGTSSGAPSTDLNGVTRPQGSGYDMGAYEKL